MAGNFIKKGRLRYNTNQVKTFNDLLEHLLVDLPSTHFAKDYELVMEYEQTYSDDLPNTDCHDILSIEVNNVTKQIIFRDIKDKRK
jgi:hypothetical protein